MEQKESIIQRLDELENKLTNPKIPPIERLKIKIKLVELQIDWKKKKAKEKNIFNKSEMIDYIPYRIPIVSVYYLEKKVLMKLKTKLKKWIELS